MSVEENSYIELSSIFSNAWRHKWIIVGATVLCGLLSYILVAQVTPLYSARSSVMLDPRSVQVLSSDAVVSDLTLNNPLLDTEVSVLRSNLLLSEVVSGFPAEDLEAFDPANRERSVLDEAKGAIRGMLSKLASPKNPAGEQAVAEVDPEEMRIQRLVGALRRSMTVWREGQSYLISVSVETEDPHLSMKLANAVTQTYIDRQIKDRVGAIQGATRFLQDRVTQMRMNVEAAEKAIESFRKTQLAELGISVTTIDQQLLDLSTQLAMSRADLAQARARFDQIQTVIDEDGFEAAAELLTSQLVVSLRQQISELAREDAELATRFGAERPERRQIAAEQESLSAELTEEVRKIVATLRNDVEVARIRVSSIQSSVTEMEERSSEMSQANLELRQLEREADASRETYQEMLNRLNETQSTEQLQRADARLVEVAVAPRAPSSPRVLLFSVLGATLGFAGSFIGLFFYMISGAGFSSAHQLSQATGLKVIATLMREPWKSPKDMLVAMRDKPYQGFAERARQLRTALLLKKTSETGGMSVLLTSAVPNEGKTSTALALAYLEGSLQRSCVVIDFDVRKSELSKLMGYQSETDLAGVLLQGKPFDDAIQPMPDIGADLITLNEPMPYLMDICPRENVRMLIEHLKTQYDLVIIDTAPLLAVADTLALIGEADEYILMVRHDSTSRGAVTDAARKMTDLGAETVSVVMTMADPKGGDEVYGYAAKY